MGCHTSGPSHPEAVESEEQGAQKLYRRTLLWRGGSTLATASAVGVAGCTSDGGTGGNETGTTRSTNATTSSRTETSTACPDAETPSSETATPESGDDAGRLDTAVDDHGHYAWFALSEDNWGRQHSPFDMSESCSRWSAEPTANGAIRCFVQNIDVDQRPQSAGFDLHLGRLGDVSEIRLVADVLQPGEYSTDLIVALYLDEDEDGEFFVWDTTSGERERWGGFGGDEEAFQTISADGETVIDDEFNFRLANRDSAEATLGQLKRGDIQYYSDDRARDTGENRGIDGDTNAAIYVGLVDTGDGSAVEALVRDVVVADT